MEEGRLEVLTVVLETALETIDELDRLVEVATVLVPDAEPRLGVVGEAALDDTIVVDVADVEDATDMLDGFDVVVAALLMEEVIETGTNDKVDLLVELGLVELGLVELGLVELGLVELGLVELVLVELGLVEVVRTGKPPMPGADKLSAGFDKLKSALEPEMLEDAIEEILDDDKMVDVVEKLLLLVELGLVELMIDEELEVEPVDELLVVELENVLGNDDEELALDDKELATLVEVVNSTVVEEIAEEKDVEEDVIDEVEELESHPKRMLYVTVEVQLYTLPGAVEDWVQNLVVVVVPLTVIVLT